VHEKRRCLSWGRPRARPPRRRRSTCAFHASESARPPRPSASRPPPARCLCGGRKHVGRAAPSALRATLLTDPLKLTTLAEPRRWGFFAGGAPVGLGRRGRTPRLWGHAAAHDRPLRQDIVKQFAMRHRQGETACTVRVRGGTIACGATDATARGTATSRRGLQGAAYFIPTVLVPLLLITHGLVFRLLLKT
jgi:hypothetical protein